MVQDIEIRDRARLLKHLGSPTSYGISSPLGCGRIALYRMENGASLGGSFPKGSPSGGPKGGAPVSF